MTRVVTALRDAEADTPTSARASARRADITRAAGELFDFEKMACLTPRHSFDPRA